MAYIVKSSLEILPWNEKEARRLMKEKEEYLKNKMAEEAKDEVEEPLKNEQENDLAPEIEEEIEEEMEDEAELEAEPAQPRRRTKAGEN